MADKEKKPVSKAQQAATAKYKKSNYDRMETLLPKGKKADLQAHAAGCGESLNSFVNRAIDEAVERDSGKGE
jgi:predicted HicB family RNase H-like nuclease